MRASTEQLPVEICDYILQFLSPEEWCNLRLTSRKWNILCRPLVWEKVAIGYGEMIAEAFNKSGRVRRKVSAKISYNRIAELETDEQFQSAVGHTKEIFLLLDDYHCEDSNGAIGRLFRNVGKINIDARFHGGEQFQQMLDKLKSADFCLDARGKCPTTPSIFIDGFKIKELHATFHRDRVDILQTRDRKFCQFSDLPSMFKHVTTLSIDFRPIDQFEEWSIEIPETVRILHLRATEKKYGMRTSSLTVPAGVECLHMEDHGNFITDCLNLERASGLKIMSWRGEEADWVGRNAVPTSLADSILHAKDSLERLVISVDSEKDRDFEFKSLAHVAFGLKQLELPSNVLEEHPSHYYSLVANCPDLEHLRLNLKDVGPHVEPESCKGLIMECLHSYPKLSFLELVFYADCIESSEKHKVFDLFEEIIEPWEVCVWEVTFRGWPVKCNIRGCHYHSRNRIYDVNLAKARLLFR